MNGSGLLITCPFYNTTLGVDPNNADAVYVTSSTWATRVGTGAPTAESPLRGELVRALDISSYGRIVGISAGDAGAGTGWAAYEYYLVCARCSGTGWRRADGEDFIGFRRRECIRAKSRAERLSAIPELFKNSTFDSYTPHNLRQERALALMQGDPGGSWYLTGAYGNGKTHLIYAQSRELVLNRRVFRISIHPDGDRIAFSAPDSTSGNEIWVLENFLSQLKNPSR